MVKSLGQFHKRAKSADGRHSRCRECARAATAAWDTANAERKRANAARWRAENPEYHREYSARWYAANTEHKRGYIAKWRAENPEYSVRHYAENTERYRENHARWRAANPDKVRAQDQRKRARKANVPHEPYNRTEIFERYGDTCAYCDAPAEHLDHVHPISKGGADAPHNLLPACAPCNLSKNAKTLAEWAATF